MSVTIDSKKDVTVEREDQEKINKFSRLNMKCTELIEDKKQMQQDLDALEDAELAIEEAFGEDGTLKVFMGEIMFDCYEDEAEIHHMRMMEEKKEKMDEVQDQIDDVEKEMKTLKAELYAKFGKAINLEKE
ncbi:unnamed protein product [Moneuplotes crassus]|uniref:Prefoldin subunit 4 n=1 Tax=Euplotes crassus TaxID=5936 RepID=A0AAD2D5H8_EUPCR|nr:unnamed protein product [Moneuplotes crassus]